MPHRFATLGLTIALLLCAPACGFAQAQKKQPDPKELQKLFEAYAKVGKDHARLKWLAGTWNCSVKDYFSNPSQPSASKGVATFQVILGGRFVQQRFKGKMDGQTFEGLGISGYDNAKKKYFSTWIDNMGTGLATMEGSYDEKTRTQTETGTSSSPLGMMKMKSVAKILSDDEFLFTMYLINATGEQKIMEISYTRAPRSTRPEKGAR